MCSNFQAHYGGLFNLIQNYFVFYIGSYFQIHFRIKLYGPNSVVVAVKGYWMLFVEEVFNPFYLFQLFSIILWSLDEYYQYATCVLILSALSCWVALYQTKQVTYLLNIYSWNINVIITKSKSTAGYPIGLIGYLPVRLENSSLFRRAIYDAWKRVDLMPVGVTIVLKLLNSIFPTAQYKNPQHGGSNQLIYGDRTPTDAQRKGGMRCERKPTGTRWRVGPTPKRMHHAVRRYATHWHVHRQWEHAYRCVYFVPSHR